MWLGDEEESDWLVVGRQRGGGVYVCIDLH